MTNQPTRLAIRVSGTVQGVFYRRSAASQAEELGLVGFVRNEPDGSVYIEAEGDESAIDAFLQWAEVGPPAAIVEDISTEELDPLGDTEFEIRYF
jgi:acylphosphatase